MEFEGLVVIGIEEYEDLKETERLLLNDKVPVVVNSMLYGTQKLYYTNDEVVQELKDENVLLAEEIKRLKNKFDKMSCWQFLKWKFGATI